MTTNSQNWYYRDFARTAPIQGPFSLAELAERAQIGELEYDSLIRLGDGEWLQADRVKELIQAFRRRRLSQREASAISTGIEIDRAQRRRLNWRTLFCSAVILGALGGALIAIGDSNSRYGLLILAGQLLSVVASVMFLCAIIRWAIEPLFAQFVDTNDQLAQIARSLQKTDEE